MGVPRAVPLVLSDFRPRAPEALAGLLAPALDALLVLAERRHGDGEGVLGRWKEVAMDKVALLV